MKVGDLFVFKRRISIHTELDNMIGIVLSQPNRYGQYKVRVGHKVLHILKHNMETL